MPNGIRADVGVLRWLTERKGFVWEVEDLPKTTFAGYRALVHELGFPVVS